MFVKLYSHQINENNDSGEDSHVAEKVAKKQSQGKRFLLENVVRPQAKRGSFQSFTILEDQKCMDGHKQTCSPRASLVKY